MQTIDLKKELKPFYMAGAAPTIIEMPPLPYLMIDGEGNPNTSTVYRDAIQALYSTAYTLKFTLKKRGEADFNVMGSEGLWWVPDMTQFSPERKDDWLWTMMIVMPGFIQPAQVEEARELALKKGAQAAKNIRLETFAEGLSAQILHIGPYDLEAPNIEKLHAFIHSGGYEFNGKHHEIYMGDPRKTAPEKWRTIIRQPIRKG